MSDWACIFDLDGVLADTEPFWDRSAIELLSRRGKMRDLALTVRCRGRQPIEVARMYVEHYQLDESPEAIRDERLAIIETLYRGGLPAMPGALELVAALAAQRVPLAVASGSPTRLVKVVLEAIDLKDAFVDAIGSDQVTNGKPSPELFLLAAERIGIQAERCVVIEDSIAGVTAALAAQMSCVHLAIDGVAPLPEADLVVATLERLFPQTLLALIERRAACCPKS